MRSLVVIVAVAALVTGATVAPAGAAPGPGCSGAAFSDPANDAFTLAGSVDIIGGWFDRHADGSVTANVQVRALAGPLEPDGLWNAWVIGWTNDGLDYQATGTMRPDGYPPFSAGLAGTPGSPTQGERFAGPKGVIRIVLPPAVGGRDGAVFANVYAYAFEGPTAVETWSSFGVGANTFEYATAADVFTYNVGACVSPASHAARRTGSRRRSARRRSR